MCGRFVSKIEASLEREFGLKRFTWPRDQVKINYNVCPTEEVPVIRMIEGERVGSLMRWQLIPWFSHGEAPKYSTINCRVETMATAPAFRDPWNRGQRCLIPAVGFYEWHLDNNVKQPHFIKDKQREYIGIAGLWERSRKESGDAIESCTIITMGANELMREIHNVTGGKLLPPEQRPMPAIVRPKNYDAWLAGTPEEARAVLTPYPSELMIAWPVSSKVNSPKNKDADLIQQIA